jgi:hypothetical protein
MDNSQIPWHDENYGYLINTYCRATVKRRMAKDKNGIFWSGKVGIYYLYIYFSTFI